MKNQVMTDEKRKDIKKAIHLMILEGGVTCAERAKCLKQVQEIKDKYGLKNLRGFDNLVTEVIAESRQRMGIR